MRHVVIGRFALTADAGVGVAVCAAVLALSLFLGGEARATTYNLYTMDILKGGTTLTAQSQVTISSSIGSVTTSAIYATAAGDIVVNDGGTVGEGSSGSGQYIRLFGIGRNDAIEQGYNGSADDGSNSTPANKDIDWDQQNGVGSPIVLIRELYLFKYDTGTSQTGKWYFELLLDGQESDTAVSLDEMLVFASPTRIDISGDNNSGWVGSNQDPASNVIANQFISQGAKLLYSLDSLVLSSGTYTQSDDNSLLLTTSGGSGSGDVGFYLPVDAVTTDPDGNEPANPVNNFERLYFYIRHGGEGTLSSVDFGAASTYEEWAYRRNEQTLQSFVPEPSTGLGGLLMAVGGAFAFFGDRRFGRRRQQS